MDLPFPPGFPPHRPGPLARFLPPLEEGSVARALEGYGSHSNLVIDPFGASPRLAVEAAQSGRGVLVAVNNPVTRFILQRTVRPFPLVDLQAALAHISAAPKDGSRLEPFLLDLYRTECIRCGASVFAESFIWERDADGPSLKVYVCERCNYAGEGPATEADWDRSRDYARRGLQHALALEQVAPAGDPDRFHAEAALSVYPGRALYALITLVKKLEQLTLSPTHEVAAQALLLSAFDAVNALWSVPEGRRRPRQLIASARYREDNVWRALERAARIWALDDPGVQLTAWPEEGLPGPGVVAVFPGPVRELIQTLPDGTASFLLTVLPRPSQAYWTLSALWAAWLWGKNAAMPIKAALRRRRYDWAWHAGALRTVMAGLAPLFAPESPILTFVPEAEPGFIASALAGFDGAGFRLEGRALRLDEEQAFFIWSVSDLSKMQYQKRQVQSRMAEAAVGALRARGEPAPYTLLHAAAWCELARERRLASLWESEESQLLTTVGDLFESALADRETFIRLGRFVEPESGLYWLADSSYTDPPLSDRVETLVLDTLRQGDGIAQIEVDSRVCQALPGLLTPDRRLLQACLRSYAVEDPQEGVWLLRSEDGPDARAADCQEIRRLLIELGHRLDFIVQDDDFLIWLDEKGVQVYAFCVLETATLGSALKAGEASPLTFVLPGGRASLVTEKMRRDPKIGDWLKDRVGVIKFRHVRRLATEIGLNQENLDSRLAIDPPAYHDPQLPLL